MSDKSMAYRRRLCAAVDIQGYSPRSGPWHGEAQRALADALDLAATRVGLDRATWWRQESGDGERAVLPDDDSEQAMVGRFPLELGAALRETNPRGDVRVRLALHHGITYRSSLGDGGEGVIEVSRIVDAEPLRSALTAAPEANLALALSETVYRAVHTGYSSLDPALFRRVVVRTKEFTAPVWILVPDADPARRPLDENPPAEDTPDAVRSTRPRTATPSSRPAMTCRSGRSPRSRAICTPSSAAREAVVAEPEQAAEAPGPDAEPPAVDDAAAVPPDQDPDAEKGAKAPDVDSREEDEPEAAAEVWISVAGDAIFNGPSGDGRHRKRRTGRLDAAEVAAATRWFVEPPGVQDALADLRTTRLVVLAGAEDTGRRCAATWLLRQVTSGDLAVLSPGDTVDQLAGKDFTKGRGYLIADFVGERGLPAIHRHDTEVLRRQLLDRGAHLVITTSVPVGRRHFGDLARMWQPIEGAELAGNLLDRYEGLLGPDDRDRLLAVCRGLSPRRSVRCSIACSRTVSRRH